LQFIWHYIDVVEKGVTFLAHLVGLATRQILSISKASAAAAAAAAADNEK